MGIIIYNGDGTIYNGRSSAAYTGEKTPGQLTGMITFDRDPNEFLRYTYDQVANRCATIYHTNSMARAAVNKPLSYRIGDGLLFRSAISHELFGMTRDAAKAWSRRFSELVHFTKLLMGWYDKSAILSRDATITGDDMLYFLREENSDLPFDPIIAGGVDIDQDKNDGDYILGVKVDKYKRPQGIKRANGDYVPFKDKDGNYNAVLLRTVERPGQVRGYSVYYSEIGRSKDFDRMWDAILQRMVMEAIQIGTRDVPAGNVDAAALAQAALGKAGKETFEKLTGSTPLVAGQLYNGGTLSFSDMKAPSNNFGTGNEWYAKMFAMATGYGPNFLIGEYPTSYASRQGEFNDTWRKIKTERASYARIVEDPFHLELLKYFMRTGQLDPLPGFWENPINQRATIAGTYLGPVPGAINPKQEIDADLAAVTGGGMSMEQLAAKYGNDYWSVVDEHEAQLERWKGKSEEEKADDLAADSASRDEEGNLDEDAAAEEAKALKKGRRTFAFWRKNK